LRQYKHTEFEKSFAVSDLGDAVDGVSSLQKRDVADVPNTKARALKQKKKQKEDDFKDMAFTGLKGRVVIF